MSGRLGYRDKLVFWSEMQQRTQAFRNEDTWAHALARVGRHLWLLLGVLTLAYTYHTQTLSVSVRLTGVVTAIWLVLLYANTDRIAAKVPALLALSHKFKSLLIIAFEDRKEIREAFELKAAVVRKLGIIGFLALIVTAYLALRGVSLMTLLVFLASAVTIPFILVYSLIYVAPFCRRIRTGTMSLAQCKRVLSATSYDLLSSVLWLVAAMVVIRLLTLGLELSVLSRNTADCEWAYSAVLYAVIVVVAFVCLFAILDILAPIFCLRGGPSFCIYMLANGAIVSFIAIHVPLLFVLALALGFGTVWNAISSARQLGLHLWCLALVFGTLTALMSVGLGVVFEWIEVLPATMAGLFFGVLCAVMIDNLLGGWFEEPLL